MKWDQRMIYGSKCRDRPTWSGYVIGRALGCYNILQFLTKTRYSVATDQVVLWKGREARTTCENALIVYCYGELTSVISNSDRVVKGMLFGWCRCSGSPCILYISKTHDFGSWLVPTKLKNSTTCLMQLNKKKEEEEKMQLQVPKCTRTVNVADKNWPW